MPEKLAELQRLWLERGARSTTCCRSTTAASSASTPTSPGGPTLVKGNSQLLFGGMGRLTRELVLNLKNKSHAVTAEIVVPEGGAEGVIIAQGGAFGGWSLYAQGRQADVLLQPARPAALQDRGRRARSRPGTHQVRMEFAYDGGGLAKGGTVTLYVDGDEGRRGPRRGDRADDLLRRRDRRRRHATPASPGQRRLHAATSSVFTGTVNWVQIDLGEDAEDADHLITPEERLRVAMARQ